MTLEIRSHIESGTEMLITIHFLQLVGEGAYACVTQEAGGQGDRPGRRSRNQDGGGVGSRGNYPYEDVRCVHSLP